MIKLSPNKELTDFLDDVIVKFDPKHHVPIGPPSTPKISEQDLLELIQQKGDVPWNNHLHAYMINLNNIQPLNELAKKLLPDKKFVQTTGRFYYPPNGFMDWHTNSNNPGYRIYATFCKESNKSFFRYKLNDSILTEYELQGWNFRLFEVKKINPYWHCIHSNTHRFSFGFQFKLNN
jgi:hypothetical protein